MQLSRCPEWMLTLYKAHITDKMSSYLKYTSCSFHEQCSHKDFAWAGLPGPPLLRNRGPVRTLGGQRYNLSPHSKWSVTWRTYLIQYGRQDVFGSITMYMHESSQCTWDQWKLGKQILRLWNVLISCFFIHTTKPNAGVLQCRFTIKTTLTVDVLKSVWLVACPCTLEGASFSSLCAISARFPYGNPTRPWPGENTAWNQNPVTYIKWLAGNSKERPNLWITGRQHWGICFHAVVSSILGDTIR